MVPRCRHHCRQLAVGDVRPERTTSSILSAASPRISGLQVRSLSRTVLDRLPVGHPRMGCAVRQSSCVVGCCSAAFKTAVTRLSPSCQTQALVSPAIAVELLKLADGRAENITGEMVTEAAKAGDVAALGCFDELGKWLGRGIAQLTAILDPGVFVIAGGVSAAGELLLARTEATFHKYLTGRGHRPTAEVRIAELGPDAGIVGAADLARHR